MQVVLNKIEQLSNGAAHIVFNTEFDGVFSFTVPKAFAARICKFIVESTFSYNALLFVNMVVWERSGEESILLTSYSPINSHTVNLQITQYEIVRADHKPYWMVKQ